MDLKAELQQVLQDVNYLMEMAKREHEEPFLMRNREGGYILADLLTTKASLLIALSGLEA